ncbi:MAG: cytochrome d ubiquinol oxidase subunit II, partial [Alicyclobacillus shizuokensis]|nr:cytochrome d ubiquinol oxidase subunit II [Alicyclobacillus shizuokensis]
MTLDLPLVFAILMGAAILVYVVLDGYDLGVGMVLPAAEPHEQDVMVGSIGPFWDANETWLVLGIGLLLVAFPKAHGVVLTALYLPVAVMLIGLMLRGAAFEFRVKAEGWHRELWNWLFWFGSFLASVAQGIMLGSYVTGFESGFGYLLFELLVAAGLGMIAAALVVAQLGRDGGRSFVAAGPEATSTAGFTPLSAVAGTRTAIPLPAGGGATPTG